jgi:fumarate reductase flavoprotein subunit
MKRRTILKLTALSLLGGRAALAAPARQERAELIVIGSGGAGFSAALTAHDLGAKVVVLEKMPITGGNTQLAAGGMNAAGTRFQAVKGIQDDWRVMYEDTFKGGQGRGIPELVELLARHSAGSVEWLADLGADMSDVGRLAGASRNRTHRPSGGAAVGGHLVEVLRRNAVQRRLDVRANSRVVELLDGPGGGVRGVRVQNKLGVRYTIEAPTVVLAAGGFSSNLARVAQYRPAYREFSSTNQPGATGDGIDLAAALGAELRDMAEIQIHPTQAAGSKILITEGVRGNGAILVNREGKRFVNELTTRDAASAAVLRQTGGTAFLIFDEAIRRSLKQIEGYFHLELIREGETPTALGQAIGADPASLAATVEAYNRFQAAKADADFQRPDMPRPIRQAKFFAIEIRPGIHYTMGGVRIDTRAAVLRPDGKAIPGLYAAGEVTGGVHGRNRLGGNSISETITFGRIAGAEAFRFARRG